MTVTRRTLLATALAVPVAGRTAHADPFADKVGDRRLFLVFSPDDDHAGFRQMVAQTRTGKFGRRDLDLIEIAGREVRVNGATVETPTAAELRRHYRVPDGGHAVRLVGKDGEVKLAKSGYVRMDEVYELIDTMPMRQQERRERGETG